MTLYAEYITQNTKVCLVCKVSPRYCSSIVHMSLSTSCYHEFICISINPCRRVARLAIGEFPDWPIWDEPERLRSRRCYSASREFFFGPLCLKGQEAFSWHLARTREGDGATGVDEQDRVPSRLYLTVGIYTRTRSSLFAKIRPGMMAIREMAVASVAAPMVMALGVVADHAETSRWVLLSSPLSPGQTGEQIQTTTNASYPYKYPRALVHVAY